MSQEDKSKTPEQRLDDCEKRLKSVEQRLNAQHEATLDIISRLAILERRLLAPVRRKR